MVKVCVVCSLMDMPLNQDYDVYVGVDYGALVLANLHIPMDLAIGDFDSIHENDMSIIQQYAHTIKTLNPIKNESDLEAALNIWSKKADVIHVYGALEGRLDHQYVNMQLMMKFENVHLINKQNHCMILKQTGEIEADGFKYFSVFALEKSNVSIQNAKYELANQELSTHDLYTLSNEFKAEKVNIEIHQGKVLLIKSKDK